MLSKSCDDSIKGVELVAVWFSFGHFFFELSNAFFFPFMMWSYDEIDTDMRLK